MDVNELEKIIAVLKNTDITELEYIRGGSTIRLKRGQRLEAGPAAYHSFHTVGPAPESVSLPVVADSAVAAAEDEGLIKIESPIVGTFYRRPSPDAEAFVEVGTHVKKGERLCIVEAMKLMNEIDSTVSGTVEKILLQDGAVVEYGEVLFLIRPD